MRWLTIWALVFTCAHSCGYAQDNKSVHAGGKLVKLMIENDTGSPLGVQWMDFEGKGQDYGTVPNGQTVPYQSYPGYVWQFISNQEVIGTYRTTKADRQTFTVSVGGSAPVPIPGNAAGAGISGSTSPPSAQGGSQAAFLRGSARKSK
jgi:hypothetical protein